MKRESFLYCQQIASIISKRRFEAIGKCLHIKDESKAPTNSTYPNYNKLVKMKLFVEEISE